MKKVPKRHMDQFTMFLSVVGFTAKTNADGSITCINPKMPKERRQIVLWQNGKMNKACQLLWWAKPKNTIDSFIAEGGFDQAFKDVFELPETIKQSLKEVS